MKQKIQRIRERAKQIKQVALSEFPVPDPGFRRRARAPMCIR